jgi:hypothetical protein
MADLSHLNIMLRRRRQVKVGMLICGSGAFPWVDSIAFL